MMRTNFETLKGLAIYAINLLHESKIIEYAVDQRAPLIEAMATELNVSFSTDEDIRDQAIEEIEDKLGQDNIPEDVTETEMYNHARKEIIKNFQGENIGGLYLEESLNQVAHRMKDFLLSSDLVEDVFASDEEIIDFMIEKLRRFQPKDNLYKQ